MWKLCFRATCSKTLSSIKRLQSLRKKTGWMEKRKEAGELGVVGVTGSNETGLTKTVLVSSSDWMSGLLGFAGTQHVQYG